MYQLKKGQEAFTVVEGFFKGKTFKPGARYEEIPREYAGRFAAIGAAQPAPVQAAEPVKPKTEKKASA
jgi:hypothetical protein